MSRAFRDAARSAGVEGVRFHDLRHSAITRWVRAGKPLAVIMQATGHTTLAMVQRYKHLSAADVRTLVT